jgi:hypothetical protein
VISHSVIFDVCVKTGNHGNSARKVTKFGRNLRPL